MINDIIDQMPVPKEYKHGFSGACVPNGHTWCGNTFSVGIFQWLPKAGGKGLKKSAVKFRIKGHISRSGEVYRRARIMCERMDKGFEPSMKSMTVTDAGFHLSYFLPGLSKVK